MHTIFFFRSKFDKTRLREQFLFLGIKFNYEDNYVLSINQKGVFRRSRGRRPEAFSNALEDVDLF